jgi:hypothetical protein
MKNAGRERSIGLAATEHVSKMIYRSRASGSNDGNAHGLADGRGEFAIETGTRTVGIHRGKKNFARAARFGFARPLHDTAASESASTLYVHLRFAHWIHCLGIAPRVNGHNDRLRPKAAPD